MVEPEPTFVVVVAEPGSELSTAWIRTELPEGVISPAFRCFAPDGSFGFRLDLELAPIEHLFPPVRTAQRLWAYLPSSSPSGWTLASPR